MDINKIILSKKIQNVSNCLLAISISKDKYITIICEDKNKFINLINHNNIEQFPSPGHIDSIYSFQDFLNFFSNIDIKAINSLSPNNVIKMSQKELDHNNSAIDLYKSNNFIHIFYVNKCFDLCKTIDMKASKNEIKYATTLLNNLFSEINTCFTHDAINKLIRSQWDLSLSWNKDSFVQNLFATSGFGLSYLCYNNPPILYIANEKSILQLFLYFLSYMHNLKHKLRRCSVCNSLTLSYNFKKSAFCSDTCRKVKEKVNLSTYRKEANNTPYEKRCSNSYMLWYNRLDNLKKSNIDFQYIDDFESARKQYLHKVREKKKQLKLLKLSEDEFNNWIIEQDKLADNLYHEILDTSRIEKEDK